MSRSEIAHLLRLARRQGAQVTRTGTEHWRVQGPLGVAILPCTPGGGRSTDNAKADLRRAGIEVPR